MRDCPILPVVAVAFLALSHQAFASPVELRSRLSKRNVEPGMIYDLNTISTCTFWYDNFRGRSCEDIRDYMFTISPEDFSRWNPSITLDCGNWQTQSYCVRVDSEMKPPPTTTSASSAAEATATSTWAPPKPTLLGWKPLGCYVNDMTLSTHLTKADGSELTVDKCEKACWDDSFDFAGVKTGTECWCGTFVGNGWASDQQECRVPCAGDKTEMCGGSDVFNVFEAQTKDTLPPPSTTWTAAQPPPSVSAATTTTSARTTAPTASAVPAWQAVGCYQDRWPTTKRTLSKLAETNDRTLTPASCQSVCKRGGYAYAGVENGRECWCGNEIQDAVRNGPAAEELCRTPCTGDQAQTCGGVSLAYLYRWTAPVVSEPWVYLGCYGEEVGRILPHELSVPGGQDRNNTRAGCIEGCNRAGYSYAGLENGRECWCDNAITKNGQLASDGASGCKTPCTGKKDETCGGVSRLDVFFKASGF